MSSGTKRCLIYKATVEAEIPREAGGCENTPGRQLRKKEKEIFDFTHNRLRVPGFRIKNITYFQIFLSSKSHLCDARRNLIGKVLSRSCVGKPRQGSSMRGIICMFKYTLCCLQAEVPSAWFINKPRGAWDVGTQKTLIPYSRTGEKKWNLN